MSDRAELEALFLEHLGWIDKVASLTCGKNGVRGDDVEDFTSWVRMKIMEDDYAILRKFRGESRIMTYLATVVVQQFFNFERARRGRWRSSAMAELLGAPAAELERLVRRDGYTVGQAGETLRTAGRTTLSDAELARLLDRLPARAPLRPVAESPRMLSSTPGTSRADERVVAAEAGARQDEIMSVLHTAIKQLDPEDQLIVRMHFADGIRLADVARVLDLEQKPLYRRVGRLRARLRTLLEGAGLSPEDVRDLRLEPDEP
ncbi:MAG TPA: sigma-70 family RNA polymerase sigma factor [Longimicrobium sp.]|nr:sigma-70 family RNA polymerase sigma factor [Longimicrobium sp.]